MVPLIQSHLNRLQPPHPALTLQPAHSISACWWWSIAKAAQFWWPVIQSSNARIFVLEILLPMTGLIMFTHSELQIGTPIEVFSRYVYFIYGLFKEFKHSHVQLTLEMPTLCMKCQITCMSFFDFCYLHQVPTLKSYSKFYYLILDRLQQILLDIVYILYCTSSYAVSHCTTSYAVSHSPLLQFLNKDWEPGYEVASSQPRKLGSRLCGLGAQSQDPSLLGWLTVWAFQLEYIR